jgi:hypothetical protein
MRFGGLVIDTVVCLTLAKWETVSGQFGGYLKRLVPNPKEQAAIARMRALRAEGKPYREIGDHIATKFGITLRPMTIKRILDRQHREP